MTAGGNLLRSAEAAEQEVEGSYRCPACGQMVNGSDHAEMLLLLHHSHVLFPHSYPFLREWNGVRRGGSI